MGKWADLAADIKKRDKEMIAEVSAYYGNAIPIEVKVNLANGRALDALVVLSQVLEYLDSQDSKEMVDPSLLWKIDNE